VYYYLEDGTEILDGVAGLWCVNAGHKQDKISEAIKNQVDKLDFASSFNTSHELPFEFSRYINVYVYVCIYIFVYSYEYIFI
jgi:beta-alanine--pyruvate transaminase